MSTPWTNIVGKPLFPSVTKELDKRSNLNQLVYDNNNEKNSFYFQPYFTVKRKPFPVLNSFGNPVEDEYIHPNRFSKLGIISDEKYNYAQGIDHIEQKGGEFRADPHITTASIDVSNYTFFTMTINFKVPDIHDFQDFKETWLDWGAPVELEFGRKTNIEETVQENDGNPNKQKLDGIVANFSFQEGGGNRSITGVITIYSSNYLDIYDSAHADDSKTESFRMFMNERVKAVYDFNNHYIYSLLEGDTINIGKIVEEAQVDASDDKSKMFYAVMDTDTYIDNLEKNSNLMETRDDHKETINRRIEALEEMITLIQQDREANANLGNDEAVRRNERDIKTRRNIINNLNKLKSGEKISIGYRERWRSFQTRVTTRDISILPYAGLPSRFSNMVGIPYGVDLIDNKELTRVIEKNTDVGGGVPLNPVVSRISTEEIDEIHERLRPLKTNIGNKDLFKYAISMFELKSHDYDSMPWYYVSMGEIGRMINDFQRDHLYPDIDQGIDEVLLNKISLNNVQVVDMTKFGYGSKFPDKIIVNPYNRKYKYDSERGEYYEEDEGEYCLLEDIYISADYIDQLVVESKTPYNFIKNIIARINQATGNVISLEKINESTYDEETSKIFSHTITFFDQSIIRDLKNDSETYHTIKLYNPKSNIKNVSVQTNLTDDMVKYAYNRARGISIDGSERILFYKSPDGEVVRRFQDPEDTNEITTHMVYSRNAEFRKRARESTQLIESASNLINSAFGEARQRVNDMLPKDEINERRYYSASILAYLKSYFTLMVNVAQSDYLTSTNRNTFQIPLNLEFEMDGISSIITGQTFKLSQESFPMRMPYDTESNLFIVSGVSHEFSGSKWTTRITCLPHISYNEKSNYEKIENLDPIRKRNLTMALQLVIFETLARITNN